MKDFLIMLYLAFTLLLTYKVHLNRNLEEFSSNVKNTARFIVCLLWSIWYVYIIH